LLAHVPEVWLLLPFLVALHAANAALTPSLIVACSWALVTDIVVVDGVVTAVVPGFNLVVLFFGAIFFNHKKTQYPLDFNIVITQEKYITELTRVKFATCTLQDDALTWWNSYVKTTITEEAYAMTWATLKKKMTEFYSNLRNFQRLGHRFYGTILELKRKKYILVAVDYLSKWVEAKALPTNDARVVVKFLKSLFSRFGTPKAIISDRGTHFCNDQFARIMSKYGVTHHLSKAYHPQTSGQVEVINYGLKRILERTVGENHALWSDKLEDALWAFRTAFKTSAYENSLIYKERTKKLHDAKIKNRIFNVGDQVLLFNSRLKIFSGKLKSCWSGPFIISEIYPYGTAKLVHPDGCNFKVNCHRLKHYHGGDPPSLEIPDVHTFPTDNLIQGSSRAYDSSSILLLLVCVCDILSRIIPDD
nr:hypothetical protein [Tanacetum cinerariifolium]